MSRKRQANKSRSEPRENSGFKPRSLSARSENQLIYIRTVLSNDITLCHGPAGTGKTHIAVGLAVRALRENDIERIVLCRPAVDSGASIGFLPGTMEEKVGPYLVPLYDELSYYVEPKAVKAWQEHRIIEIVPLSLMRGRTFNNSFVILDEAQNATFGEIRMFLTRIGMNSRMVLVGDLYQSDLPRHEQGAFLDAIESLEGLHGVGVCGLDASDIVRHHLIAHIEERLAH